MKVQIQKLHPDAQLPKRGSELAGGWDVTVTEIIEKELGFVVCKLGFALQPPVDHKVTIVPRSSLTGTLWVIQNSPGLGDPAFNNGVIGGGAFSRPASIQYPPFPYAIGERVAQMYIEEIIPIEFEEVETLSETERGEGGFGSSGNK